MKMKNTKNRKSKISYFTVQMIKAQFSELKRNIKFINKQRLHTKIFPPKSFQFLNLKGFIFYKFNLFINKMYIFGRYKKKLQKIKIFTGTNTTFEKSLKQKICIF